jgi:hypothetical protein
MLVVPMAPFAIRSVVWNAARSQIKKCDSNTAPFIQYNFKSVKLNIINLVNF